jgi:REP element-mobilizing transposase RayT
MDASNPGNANLPIGVSSAARGTRQIASRASPKNQPAIQENGAPGKSHPRNDHPTPRWQSRGYLPHFESSEATQHVTFHLADSLPQSAILRIEADVKLLPKEKQDAERRKKLDAWIDAGHGSCILRNPQIARMVQDSLLSFDSQRYRLLAWVIMPNHVHILFQPLNGWEVAKIVASWKKFTARKIMEKRSANREIGAPRKPAGGSHVWHREYWDRYIRDQRHFDQAIAYIHQNPVKANLAAAAESWPWSSAFPGNANLLIGGAKVAIQENGDPR